MLSWTASIVSAIELERALQTPVFCIAVSIIFSRKDKMIKTLHRVLHITRMTRLP
jgi:hypothetical protein